MGKKRRNCDHHGKTPAVLVLIAAALLGGGLGKQAGFDGTPSGAEPPGCSIESIATAPTHVSGHLSAYRAQTMMGD